VMMIMLTTDACDCSLGCVNVQIDCDDNDSSTCDSCDPVLGCQNVSE